MEIKDALIIATRSKFLNEEPAEQASQSRMMVAPSFTMTRSNPALEGARPPQMNSTQKTNPTSSDAQRGGGSNKRKAHSEPDEGAPKWARRKGSGDAGIPISDSAGSENSKDDRALLLVDTG